VVGVVVVVDDEYPHVTRILSISSIEMFWLVWLAMRSTISFAADVEHLLAAPDTIV
jgi:hypothetical protein